MLFQHDLSRIRYSQSSGAHVIKCAFTTYSFRNESTFLPQNFEVRHAYDLKKETKTHLRHIFIHHLIAVILFWKHSIKMFSLTSCCTLLDCIVFIRKYKVFRNISKASEPLVVESSCKNAFKN